MAGIGKEKCDYTMLCNKETSIEDCRIKHVKGVLVKYKFIVVSGMENNFYVS